MLAVRGRRWRCWRCTCISKTRASPVARCSSARRGCCRRCRTATRCSFSRCFVGLWVLWFVVLQRQWRTAGADRAGAGVCHASRWRRSSANYVAVHARNGFARSLARGAGLQRRRHGLSVRAFRGQCLGLAGPGLRAGRADVPWPRDRLAVRRGFLLLRSRHAGGWSDRRGSSRLRVLALAFAAVQLASAVAVAVGGRGTSRWGRFRRMPPPSARPFMSAAGGAGVRVRLVARAIAAAIREASPLALLLVATLLMWWWRWGPIPRWAARRRRCRARSLLLMQAPGFEQHPGAGPVLADGDAVAVGGGGVRRGRAAASAAGERRRALLVGRALARACCRTAGSCTCPRRRAARAAESRRCCAASRCCICRPATSPMCVPRSTASPRAGGR